MHNGPSWRARRRGKPRTGNGGSSTILASPFRFATTDLWAVWDAVRCPTLLLRGAESDLLSPDTAAAMRGRGPKPRFVEFPGVGHAPMLLTPEQIAPVAAFLEGEGT